MKITIVTLFPKMISGFFEESILKRAQEKNAVKIELVNLRDFALDDYKSVDDRPYGGGAGMVIRAEPVYAAIEKIRNENSVTSPVSKIVLTSPKGQKYDQQLALEYTKLDHLVILAGHYEEFDERVRDVVDEEVSLGDFVMTGGEITAAAIVDSVVRLLPGVLKKEDATQFESFYEVTVKDLVKIVGNTEVLKNLTQQGKEKVHLLEYPQYTRPEEFNGKKVPEVLLSGDHKKIEDWRTAMAYQETLTKRPDLLK